MPVGGIIMWSGSEVPEGWALCNGQNGHPNLLDRFIVGAGSKYAIGAQGGKDEITLTENQMPSHNHGGTTGSENLQRGNGKDWRLMHPATYRNKVKSDGSTSVYDRWNQDSVTLNDCIKLEHQHTINSAGGGASHENRPPYYALAFIIKL
ncbi:MAG: tail fiber protein [Pseudomonadales bacterium]|nr:tail fiber protein [Pseudomonadales bacterium]